jgi:hypothetical protein
MRDVKIVNGTAVGQLPIISPIVVLETRICVRELLRITKRKDFQLNSQGSVPRTN